MKKNVAILGGGSWGTALAVHLAINGVEASIYDINLKQVQEINLQHTNQRFLPGVELPKSIKASTDLASVLTTTDEIFIVVPSHLVRSICEKIILIRKDFSLIINCSKGIEENSLLTMSEVIKEVVPSQMADKIVSLSGPTHAEEVSLGLPSAAVCASQNLDSAQKAQELLMSPTFRIYTSNDVIGVELGGAVKNVIAIASGICEGLGYGDNTKAALITRGLMEINRLAVQLGADPKTLSGLAGIGDLIVTCASKHSRNWKFGYKIGQGKSLPQALKEVDQVVEGVRTTLAVYQLAKQQNIEMPITQKIYQVLFLNLKPKEAVNDLMSRDPKLEM